MKKETINTTGRLGKHEASIRYLTGKNQVRLSLNTTISVDILKNEMTKCSLHRDLQNNKCYLVFGKSEGYSFSPNGSGKCLRVYSKRLVKELLGFFNLSEKGQYRLRLSDNVANSDSYITFQVLDVYDLEQVRKKKAAEMIKEEKAEPEKPAEENPIIDFFASSDTPADSSEKNLSVEESISILKKAGYIVLAPHTHYVAI